MIVFTDPTIPAPVHGPRVPTDAERADRLAEALRRLLAVCDSYGVFEADDIETIEAVRHECAVHG